MHQEFVNDDRKGLMMFFGVKPFANIKYKWIKGLISASATRPSRKIRRLTCKAPMALPRSGSATPSGVAAFDMFKAEVDQSPRPGDAAVIIASVVVGVMR